MVTGTFVFMADIFKNKCSSSIALLRIISLQLFHHSVKISNSRSSQCRYEASLVIWAHTVLPTRPTCPRLLLNDTPGGIQTCDSPITWSGTVLIAPRSHPTTWHCVCSFFESVCNFRWHSSDWQSVHTDGQWSSRTGRHRQSADSCVDAVWCILRPQSALWWIVCSHFGIHTEVKCCYNI